MKTIIKHIEYYYIQYFSLLFFVIPAANSLVSCESISPPLQTYTIEETYVDGVKDTITAELTENTKFYIHAENGGYHLHSDSPNYNREIVVQGIIRYKVLSVGPLKPQK